MRIPYTYVITTRAVNRVETERHMDASAEFAPRVVGAAEAPVVLRHAGFHGYELGYQAGEHLIDRVQRPPDDLVDVRMHEGRLYEAVRLTAGYGEPVTSAYCLGTDLVTPEDVVRMTSRVRWIQGRVEREHSIKDRKFHPESLRITPIKSEREGALKEVTEALDVIVVDGVVHRWTPEPVFQLLKGVVSVVREDQAAGHTYGLGEADLLADMLRARRGNDAEATVAMLRDMAQVIDPSAVRHAQPPRTTWAAAGELTSAARWGFGERGVDTMMAFADLHEALRHQAGTGEREIVDLMEAYCDLAEKEPVEGLGGRMSESSHRIARAEVRAWRARAERRVGAPHDPELDAVELDVPGL